MLAICLLLAAEVVQDSREEAVPDPASSPVAYERGGRSSHPVHVVLA